MAVTGIPARPARRAMARQARPELQVTLVLRAQLVQREPEAAEGRRDQQEPLDPTVQRGQRAVPDLLARPAHQALPESRVLQAIPVPLALVVRPAQPAQLAEEALAHPAIPARPEQRAPPERMVLQEQQAQRELVAPRDPPAPKVLPELPEQRAPPDLLDPQE